MSVGRPPAGSSGSLPGAAPQNGTAPGPRGGRGGGGTRSGTGGFPSPLPAAPPTPIQPLGKVLSLSSAAAPRYLRGRVVLGREAAAGAAAAGGGRRQQQCAGGGRRRGLHAGRRRPRGRARRGGSAPARGPVSAVATPPPCPAAFSYWFRRGGMERGRREGGSRLAEPRCHLARRAPPRPAAHRPRRRHHRPRRGHLRAAPPRPAGTGTGGRGAEKRRRPPAPLRVRGGPGLPKSEGTPEAVPPPRDNALRSCRDA